MTLSVAVPTVLLLLGLALLATTANGFGLLPHPCSASYKSYGSRWAQPQQQLLLLPQQRIALKLSSSSDDDAANESTLNRIQELVDTFPVLLFMKGSKLFPQCGFSNTAVQILNTYGIPYHTVDVLADEQIRQGVKVFSQWPTIPQLYVAGEFVGGSDIMIELYQSGELGEMIEKLKADVVE